MEKTDVLPRWHAGSKTRRSRHNTLLLAFALCISTYLLTWTFLPNSPLCWRENYEKNPTPQILLKDIPKKLKSFQDCSIRNLFTDTNLDFLSTAHPLPIPEFVSRRDRLAQALDADGLDAFLVEPGYTFTYYANVSQPDWEVRILFNAVSI